MALEIRNIKRRRSDSEDSGVASLPGESASGESFIRGDPWLPDGNIILQAENTRFRVLQSILVGHSKVLDDMILQQAVEGAERQDGFVVVKVPEKADSWAHLLKAIFQHSYVSGINSVSGFIAYWPLLPDTFHPVLSRGSIFPSPSSPSPPRTT